MKRHAKTYQPAERLPVAPFDRHGAISSAKIWQSYVASCYSFVEGRILSAAAKAVLTGYESISMESSAYKEMMAQIANIAGHIREARDEKKRKGKRRCRWIRHRRRRCSTWQAHHGRMHRPPYRAWWYAESPPRLRDTAAIGGQHSVERGRDNRHPVPQPQCCARAANQKEGGHRSCVNCSQ